MMLKRGWAEVVDWAELALKLPSWMRYSFAISLGIVLAVCVGLADAGESWLKVLLALVGFVVAFTSSRLLDAFADRRKTRRKIYMSLLRIRLLNLELVLLMQETADVHAGNQDDSLPLCLSRMARIGALSAKAPDFDEIIDSSDDLTEAAKAENVFHTMHSLLGSIPEANLMSTMEVILSPVGQNMLSANNGILNGVSDHFAKRLDDKAASTTFVIPKAVVL